MQFYLLPMTLVGTAVHKSKQAATVAARAYFRVATAQSVQGNSGRVTLRCQSWKFGCRIESY